MRYLKYFSYTNDTLRVDTWDETLTLLKYNAGTIDGFGIVA